MTDDSFALEESAGFEPKPDRLPKMPEPLPVRISAVADVRLPALVELEREHDAFYCELLKMVRDEPRTQRIYRADNHCVVFELTDEPIQQKECRPLLVEIDSLGELERKLLEREIEYERIRSLSPGMESLMMRDPSGNWVEVVELRTLA
jgi:hypothetical protein